MASDAPPSRPDGAEIMRQFVPASPFARLLGIRLVDVGPDRAELLLPYTDDVVTVGDMVHGGAIATLLDCAAMVAAWATGELPEALRGSTVSLSVNYVAAARATDVRATATVARRARTLVFVDVAATDATGAPVAHGIATYRLG